MTDEIERVRQLYEEASQEVHRRGLCGTSYDTQMIAILAKRLQPKPVCEKCGGMDRVTREAGGISVVYHNCQPKPVPAPKVWSVSDKTVLKLRDQIKMRFGGQPTSYDLNAIVDDIIRDRPDAVAKEWERRMREAIVRGDHVISERDLASVRRDLFPEVEG